MKWELGGLCRRLEFAQAAQSAAVAQAWGRMRPAMGARVERIQVAYPKVELARPGGAHGAR